MKTKTDASAEPMLDGLLVRGLYLSNPKQQEVVVDYFRNLLGSPFFAIDPNNQAKVIKPANDSARNVLYITISCLCLATGRIP